jgi:hypothetical protein
MYYIHPKVYTIFSVLFPADTLFSCHTSVGFVLIDMSRNTNSVIYFRTASFYKILCNIDG